MNFKKMELKLMEDNKNKGQMLVRKLETLASVIKSTNYIDDCQINTIIQNLLDYRKTCVALTTVEAISSEDESVSMDKLLELL